MRRNHDEAEGAGGVPGPQNPPRQRHVPPRPSGASSPPTLFPHVRLGSPRAGGHYALKGQVGSLCCFPQYVEDCRQVPSLRVRSSHLRGRANTLTGADNVSQARPLSGREEGWVGTLEGDKLLYTDDMLDRWFSNLAACSCPLGSL